MKEDKLNQATNNNEAAENKNEKKKSFLKLPRKRSSKKEQTNNKKVRLRIFPIWLRIILVIFWLSFVIALGLMIGYGLIGDGSPMDVFKKETWIHIVDIYSGKEE